MNNKLKLIKYGHEHCGPCRALKPILEAIALKYADTLEFVDKDTYSMSVEELTAANLRAVPAMTLYDKAGNSVWSHIGYTDGASIEAVIDQVLETI